MTKKGGKKKNTTTFSISMPNEIASEVAAMAHELNISRSAFITASMSVIIHSETSIGQKKAFLNSLYGRGLNNAI